MYGNFNLVFDNFLYKLESYYLSNVKIKHELFKDIKDVPRNII